MTTIRPTITAFAMRHIIKHRQMTPMASASLFKNFAHNSARKLVLNCCAQLKAGPQLKLVYKAALAFTSWIVSQLLHGIHGGYHCGSTRVTFENLRGARITHSSTDGPSQHGPRREEHRDRDIRCAQIQLVQTLQGHRLRYVRTVSIQQ